MARSLRHRGPDASGQWLDSTARVGFSHTRLSILDLTSAGAQPMTDEATGAVICFNGEIYNHLALRKSLEQPRTGSPIAISRRFSSHSDTEVLLRLLVDQPVSTVLAKLRGMFAFAFWDPRTQQLTLARDTFGEKPLHYGVTESGALVFGSEIKALAASSLIPIEVNPLVFGEFLTTGALSSNSCAFRGIDKLAPGSFVQFSLSPKGPLPTQAMRFRTPSMEPRLRQREVGEQEAREIADEIYTRLERSVESQISADVPVGAFLSGGIDSSLVVAMMRKYQRAELHTFSVGFSEPGFDESTFASAVAESIGTTHHRYLLSDADVQSVAQEMPVIWDEPFADSSQIPMFLVSKFARQTVKVCLSGDGADELFQGYGRYADFERWNRIPAAEGLSNNKLYAALYRSLTHLEQCTRPHTVHTIARRLAQGMAVLSSGDLALRYGGLTAQCRNIGSILRAQGPFSSSVGAATVASSELLASLDSIDAASLLDLQHYLPDDILVKVDRASMANGLEVRAPFLDVDVAERALAAPSSLLREKSVLKALLKRRAQMLIPGFPAHRKKMGFGVPMDKWLRTTLKPWGDAVLLDASRLAMEHVDLQTVRSLWGRHQEGRADSGTELWHILALVQWLNAFDRGLWQNGRWRCQKA